MSHATGCAGPAGRWARPGSAPPSRWPGPHGRTSSSSRERPGHGHEPVRLSEHICRPLETQTAGAVDGQRLAHLGPRRLDRVGNPGPVDVEAAVPADDLPALPAVVPPGDEPERGGALHALRRGGVRAPGPRGLDDHRLRGGPRGVAVVEDYFPLEPPP